MDGTIGPGRRATWVGVVVVVVALGLRVWNLGSPQTVFDEAWYPFDAVAFLGGGGCVGAAGGGDRR
jgi:predicted membrane-bound mannosyltransferase